MEGTAAGGCRDNRLRLGEGWAPQLSLVFTQGTQLLHLYVFLFTDLRPPILNYFTPQKVESKLLKSRDLLVAVSKAL